MKVLKTLFTCFFSFFTFLIAGFVLYSFVLYPYFFHMVKIIHVIDADTIKVLDGGKVSVVQLIGVDAPEYNFDHQFHQCFDRESLQLAVERYYALNSEVQLKMDKNMGDRDPHGRLLRYVYLKNGDLLNEKLIGDGLARQFLMPYEHYEHQDQMEKAQISAKSKQSGFWNPRGCNGQY